MTPPAGLKVLLIDDKERYLAELAAHLSKKFSVITASGPEKAIALMEKESFAVVVSSQEMPLMKGSQLLTVVARLYPQTVRVLLMSGCENDSMVEAINKAGVYRLLSKDMSPTEIEALVCQALEKFKNGI